VKRETCTRLQGKEELGTPTAVEPGDGCGDQAFNYGLRSGISYHRETEIWMRLQEAKRTQMRDSCCVKRDSRAGRYYLGAIVVLTIAFVAPGLGFSGEAQKGWQTEWEKTVNAAEQEGQLTIYSLSEAAEIFINGGFQKKFPKIKISTVSARGGELVSRIMPERRAGKFLADIGHLGNDSPYTLYQSKVLDPIISAFILPEVQDGSNWWEGRHHFIDPEAKYIFIYVGAPLYLVAYNTNLVKASEIKSYWDFLNPRWKGKIAAFDLRSGGFAATRDRFFYHHPELGAKFIKRIYGEMDVTFYRQYPQGEDWLAAGRFALCFCRHQSISEAKSQGLPVDLIDPAAFKEGVGVETRAKTLVLLNKAPHPNAAKVFINWFLSKEGQSDFQKVSGKYISAGSEFSLRMDIPKEDVLPRNRLVPGVKYIPQWNPEMFDMKAVRKVFDEALAEAGKQ
jgi:ABC-type Fe3+ transport system substrate-binding protein